MCPQMCMGEGGLLLRVGASTRLFLAGAGTCCTGGRQWQCWEGGPGGLHPILEWLQPSYSPLPASPPPALSTVWPRRTQCCPSPSPQQ